MSSHAIGPAFGRDRQRRWQRQRVDLPVRVITERVDRVVIIRASASDLNEGGVSIHVPLELHVGEKISLDFNAPPANSNLRIDGIVRNRRGYEYGVEFCLDNSQDIDAVTQIRSMVDIFRLTEP